MPRRRLALTTYPPDVAVDVPSMRATCIPVNQLTGAQTPIEPAGED